MDPRPDLLGDLRDAASHGVGDAYAHAIGRIDIIARSVLLPTAADRIAAIIETLDAVKQVVAERLDTLPPRARGCTTMSYPLMCPDPDCQPFGATATVAMTPEAIEDDGRTRYRCPRGHVARRRDEQDFGGTYLDPAVQKIATRKAFGDMGFPLNAAGDGFDPA